MTVTAWQGPPTDFLGRPAAFAPFAARSSRAVIALQQILAYPEGCLFGLRLAVRRGTTPPSLWDSLVGDLIGHHPASFAPETGLRCGVRFPDGTAATVTGSTFSPFPTLADPPEQPVLVGAGGSSSADDQSFQGERQLWLWPLPPPGPFTLTVEWRDLGVNPATVTLDSAAIFRAAQQAEKIWT